MIDLDLMEQQLTAALTDEVDSGRTAAAPAPPPPPSPRGRRGAVVDRVPAPSPEPPRRSRPSPCPAPTTAPELLALGLLEEAEAAMAVPPHPLDALTWATMRALLAGRRDDARRGVEELRKLAQRTDDAEAGERSRIQWFWAAFEWGTEAERFDVLDHCRERAYRFDDRTWWGNLTLLSAAMGKADEATRALDATSELLAGAPKDGLWLDVVTNCIEAAALLGDAGRVAAAFRSLRWPDDRLVVVGPGVLCKGSVERYRGLGFAALGRWAEASECFRRAEAAHRAIGAGPLLARTLQQASGAPVAA